MSEVKHMVEFLIPGSLYAESQTREIEERDPDTIDFPDNCFAFRFYDVKEQLATLEDGSTFMHKSSFNHSKRFYPLAQVMTAEDVEKLPGDHRILLANMRCNGWKEIVRTRLGNFQPLEEGDIVI